MYSLSEKFVYGADLSNWGAIFEELSACLVIFFIETHRFRSNDKRALVNWRMKRHKGKHKKKLLALEQQQQKPIEISSTFHVIT